MFDGHMRLLNNHDEIVETTVRLRELVDTRQTRLPSPHDTGAPFANSARKTNTPRLLTKYWWPTIRIAGRSLTVRSMVPLPTGETRDALSRDRSSLPNCSWPSVCASHSS